jgi:hypothetical protein
MKSTARPKSIDGKGVLYHFLQKELQESNEDVFQMLFSRLAVSLGVWFSPSLYGRWPLLVPYAVRDPESRGNRARGIPDQWSAPNADGYLRDDNSLIKNLPASLPIRSRRNAEYRGRTIGNGFVASHVWRIPNAQATDAPLAARDPHTYSFVPNLIWLPSNFAGLTDREGSFAQRFLQALSLKLFREVPVSDGVRPIVEDSWRRLPNPEGIDPALLPDISELNLFEPTDAFVSFRRRQTSQVADALASVEAGLPVSGKAVASRYTEGLPAVNPRRAAVLRGWLQEILEATDNVEQQ